MKSVVHISSLLITAQPQRIDEVRDTIAAIAIADVSHVEANGKIIVTLETESEAEIVDALSEIQLIEGVVNASLVFHQVDDLSEHADHGLSAMDSQNYIG